jgi:hypothetical protein
MEMAGRSRMLLVLLLGGQRLETSGIAVSDCPSPEKTDTQFSVSLAQERRLRLNGRRAIFVFALSVATCEHAR